MFNLVKAIMLAVGVALITPVFSITSAEAANCGGLNQKACSWSKATYRGKPLGCARGQFYDVSTRRCWSCPSGFKRTIFPIKSKKACQKRGKVLAGFTRARLYGAVGCRRPGFFDPRKGGQCWTCPAGFKRTVWPVTSKKACKAKPACRPGLKKKKGYCVAKRAKNQKLLNLAKRDKQRLQRVIGALAKALSPLQSVNQIKYIKRLVKNKDSRSLQKLVYNHPRVSVALESLRAAGFKTMTLGVSSSLSVGVGGMLETGTSLDTYKRNRPYIYQTRGYSGGVSLQAGNTIVLSGYFDPNHKIGNRPRGYFKKWKPSHGFVSSIDGLVAGVGVALWYDYNNRLSGFSVSYSLGSVGLQVWEYNRVETMIQ